MKAGFLDAVRLEILDDNSNDGRGSWQNLQDVRFWSELVGSTILIPAGFIYDLASVPRWPLMGSIFLGRASRAALPHDWLYWTHQFPRDVCDRIFLEAMLSTGVPADIADSMYLGVRAGGWAAWEEDGQEQPTRIKALIWAARQQAHA